MISSSEYIPIYATEHIKIVILLLDLTTLGFSYVQREKKFSINPFPVAAYIMAKKVTRSYLFSTRSSVCIFKLILSCFSLYLKFICIKNTFLLSPPIEDLFHFYVHPSLPQYLFSLKKRYRMCPTTTIITHKYSE